ncbi:MAG: TolC family protein [Proteobacteria bacterium]|nr:TolC family protein [Pseudomonadota bacterium]
MRKLLLFLSIVILAAVVRPAYGAIELSLEKAIEMAKANNEELNKAREDRETGRDRVREARGAFLPTLSGSYNYSHYFDIMGVPVFDTVVPDGSGGYSLVPHNYPAKYKNEHTFGLTASQVLFSSGRVTSYYRAARAGRSASEHNYARQERAVTLQVEEAYLNALLAREALQITRVSLENTLKDHEIITQRQKSGLGSEFEVMGHAVELNNRRIEAINAGNGQKLAHNYLKVIIGIDPAEEISLTDSYNEAFPDLDYEKIHGQMLGQEPSLRALENLVQVNENLYRAQRADYFPLVAAFGSYQYSGNSDKFFTDKKDFDQTIVAGVQVTVPIYEGGVKNAKKNEAFREVTKSRLELSRVRKMIELDLENTYLAYVSSLKELEAVREMVQLAEKAYGLSQLRYQSGLGSLTELRDAELSLTRARLLLSKTMKDVNLNLYKIQSYTTEMPRSQP